MDSLDSIGLKYGTDKASNKNNFLFLYDSLFSRLRFKPIKMLEIGILGGASLKTWREYFGNGTIVGFDINADCRKYAADGIKIEIGDQGNEKILEDIRKRHGPFDIVLDDGSHMWDHQTLTLKKLFEAIKAGGYYVIEDYDVSYGKYVDTYRGTAKHSPADFIKTISDYVAGRWVLRPEQQVDAVARAIAARCDYVLVSKGVAVLKVRDF